MTTQYRSYGSDRNGSSGTLLALLLSLILGTTAPPDFLPHAPPRPLPHCPQPPAPPPPQSRPRPPRQRRAAAPGLPPRPRHPRHRQQKCPRPHHHPPLRPRLSRGQRHLARNSVPPQPPVHL